MDPLGLEHHVLLPDTLVGTTWPASHDVEKDVP